MTAITAPLAPKAMKAALDNPSSRSGVPYCVSLAQRLRATAGVAVVEVGQHHLGVLARHESLACGAHAGVAAAR